MGIFGPPNVKKMRDRKNVKGLIKALSYPEDRKVREAAALALGNIGDPLAIEPLIAALKDDFLMKESSVLMKKVADTLTLGQMPDSRITRALDDVSEKLKIGFCQFAAEALVKIGDPAVELLLDALKEGEYHRRRGASWALGNIGDFRAVEPLIATLKDKTDEILHLQVINALGKLGDLRDVEPLNAVFKAGDESAQEAAAVALAKMDPSR